MFEYTLAEKEPLTRSGMSKVVFGLESGQEDCFGIEDRDISWDVARTFGSYLRAVLERERVIPADFARRVGLTRGQITNVMNGKRRPPSGKADRWADVIGLHGQEREDFIDLAAATYLPGPERERWWAILARLHLREASERRAADAKPPSAGPTFPS